MDEDDNDDDNEDENSSRPATMVLFRYFMFISNSSDMGTVDLI